MLYRLVLFSVLLALVSCTAATARRPAATQPTTQPARPLAPIDPQELYARVSPSLVGVGFTYNGELGRREIVGAGVIVRDDGLVMTSLSLFPPQIPDEQMIEFKIIVPGDTEEEIDAVFEGRDERSNVAFVRPSGGDRKWEAVHFEDTRVQVGQQVYSVGLLPKDAGYKPYLTQATVAAVLRGPVPQVLVDGGLAAVSAPVFTRDGRAIGLVHMQPEQTVLLNDSRAPLGAALKPPKLYVPARDFLLSLEDPPTAGSPLKLPWLGVAQLAGLNKEVAEYFDLEGQPAVQVGDVIPDTPADKAGLKPSQVIVKLNGQPLERGDTPDEAAAILTRKLRRMKAGSQVMLSVLTQKGQPLHDVTVTLEEQPKPVSRAARYFAEDLGFVTRDVVFWDTYERRLAADAKGVVVALVKPSSAAQSARLENNDMVTEINRTPITDVNHFKETYEAFRKEHPSDAVVLEVLRAGQTQVIRIEPPQ